jgi:hypothetical protein
MLKFHRKPSEKKQQKKGDGRVFSPSFLVSLFSMFIMKKNGLFWIKTKLRNA